MAGIEITAKGHATIVDRLSSLRQALIAGPNDRGHIGADLAKLVGSMPKQDPGIGVAILVDAYREAIGSAPAWAVHEARLLVIRGEAGLPGPFLPAPPELAGIIAAILRPFRRDVADLEALASLGTTDASPEERALVVDGFDALALELGKPDPHKAAKYVPTDDEIRAAGARWLT